MDVFEEAGSELRARMSVPSVPASEIEARGRRRRRARQRKWLGMGVVVILVSGVVAQQVVGDGDESVLADGGPPAGGEGEAAEPTGPPCVGPGIPASGPEGVEARLEVDDRRQPVGEGFDGTLVVRNGSADELRFTFDGSGVMVYVVEPGADEVAGHDSGPRLLSLKGQQLPPGATGEPIRAHGGVASCRPASGTAVQPGSYELVAVIPLPDGRSIVSNRVPVEITAPPAGG